MRARNIKPGFFKNDTLAELDFAGRLLFIGLWGLADRAGRLEDRPKKIKAEVFPYDDVNVDSFLGELARLGFIRRYQAGGAIYIQIVNFDKHQNPHPREADSLIPEPAGDCQGSAQDLPSRAESPSLATESPCQGLLATTTTTIADPSGEVAAVVDLISKNVCLVSSQVETNLIRDWLASMPPGWVIEAVNQAALGKARSLRYIDTILQAWAAKYRPDELPWLIERRERQQRPARERPQTFIERAEAMLCQH